MRERVVGKYDDYCTELGFQEARAHILSLIFRNVHEKQGQEVESLGAREHTPLLPHFSHFPLFFPVEFALRLA